MLPSSVRRVATAAAPPSPAFASILSSGPRAAVVLSGRPGCHQRRWSSSSPDNGPKDLAAGQSVPASSGEAKASKAKSAGERRKRKAKDSSAAKQLPVVPSTQHLSHEALGLSTFFSLHRPISVTHSFPKTITADAFAAIFAPGTRGAKVSDVISTLSDTVDQLEQPMARMGLGGQRQEQDAATPAGHQRIHVKNPDGSESHVYVQLNTMSGDFLPFRPPPAPQPASAAADSSSAVLDHAEDAAPAPTHRVYKALLTIEETTDADGQVKVLAHPPQLIDDAALEPRQPRTFLERMALRQLRHEDALRSRLDDDGGMLAISVRRQKKLKMKKKKYKKLMRKTRNLRRKLDRV